MANNRSPSIVVWLPDYEAHLVIDAESLQRPGFSIQTIAVWKGKTNFRTDVTHTTFAYYKGIRRMAHQTSEDKQ